ncbi:MAG: GldG family protein, partial [Cyanobacteria bacterium]|nr:GldG family protein [Cyanobacteriota bacterium]
ITRGVIDFRDLYYYMSLMGLFLSLNVYGVEKLRWANNPTNSRHFQWFIITVLCIANFVACNFWLQQVSWARADLTENHIYSISQSTRKYLALLKEPLLIRGYFSKKTHPYLAPLMPQLKDLLKEYQLAGHGKVKVEFVDPLDAPEIEQEAGEKYGIKPVQFQTSSKYQAAIVNSYFDVLVSYGDQYELLDWQSLIEVKMGGTDERQLDVELRNPEYDITSAIKNCFYNYKAEENQFADVKEPITFYGYISPDTKLPLQLKEFKKQLQDYLNTLSKSAGDKFKIEIIDPDASGGKIADEITKTYGFSRMVAGLDLSNSFWFYMVMKDKNQVAQIPLDPRELNKEALERNIKSALKKFTSGSRKVVAFMGKVAQYEQDQKEQKHFKFLHQFLEDEYFLRPTDLKDGLVPADADILLMLAPEKLNETQLFALDQFLMKGGTVIISSNSYFTKLDKSVLAVNNESGLEQWLTDKGIKVEKSMVLDPQCSSFPIPKQRVVGHYFVDETELIPYPFFPTIRGEGLNSSCDLNSGIGEISMPWSSPIIVDSKKMQGKQVTKLMTTSVGSWLDDTGDIEPNFKKHPKWGFPEGQDKGPRLVSVIVEGTFDSSFKGKKSPFAITLPGAEPKPGTEPGADYRAGVIEKSADTARIVVFASNSFASDEYLLLSTLASGTRNLKPVELIKNTLDWSLGDRDLLSLRGRGHFARTLYPMTNEAQFLFECMNYGFALAGLGVVWLVCRQARVRRRKRHRDILGLEGVKA